MLFFPLSTEHLGRRNDSRIVWACRYSVCRRGCTWFRSWYGQSNCKTITWTSGNSRCERSLVLYSDFVKHPNIICLMLKRNQISMFCKPPNQVRVLESVKRITKRNWSQLFILLVNTIGKILIEKAVAKPKRLIKCDGKWYSHCFASREIVPSNEFYDYDAKYVDGKSKAEIPAKLSPQLIKNYRRVL